MNIRQIIFIFLLFLINTGISAQPKGSYKNPILERSMPDPTVVRDKEGNFYMFSTNMAKKVPIYTSSNLVDWRYFGDSFTSDQMPTGLDGGGIWAPDVIEYKGYFLMAYSYSKGGEIHHNGIGLAICPTPKGPFKNLGLLFTSDEAGVLNSIDPALVKDKNKLYLLWGSFHGIYITELLWNKKNQKFTVDLSSKVQLAGDIFEGAHIMKRGKYYYLFASIGSCCKRDESTYRVVVGRSLNLFGPYLDAHNLPMIENEYELFLSGNDKFVGPGHGSTIITDKDGKTWYIYHSYIKGEGEKGRRPMLDEVRWNKDGWPYIGEPTKDTTSAPRF